ncbi:hypothetical protein A3J23_02870 [Candidatus Peregrinibacteria bacterium RIFCSPLOWO2_02_FULL_48_14]|nr:MAG: hypothetical protein A2974_00580 [Candidatus Peregrinibacteria bacterium RIFCSPLOWO2_01_FULL_48_20]OGJ45171.1 MAG: hypothetical protein A3J23_02870 [Candidatus Peregrinibacteria bacterium RIFCSPLOWO2_02_FULL_48_14]
MKKLHSPKVSLKKCCVTTSLLFSLLFSLFLSPLTTQAATTLLPDGGDAVEGKTVEQCSVAVDVWTAAYAEKGYTGLPDELEGLTKEQMMACALKSGNMAFWMLPFFINNVLEFIIALAGLIAVLMIIVGAYYYIAGGVTDDKEKGKTIIKYALGGFVLALSSWVLVNVLLLLLTA